MSFLLSLEAVGILLAMAVPGFIIGKLKKVDTDAAIKTLSVILLYVCQPFININSFLNTPFRSETLLNLVFVFLIAAILMVFLLIISAYFFKKLRFLPENTAGIYANCAALGNIGYLCVPFLQVLTNDTEVILYASTGMVAFNLVAWTLGTYYITGDKKHISLKKAVLNVPTLSFLLVLPFFLLNLNFLRTDKLSTVANACAMFANLTAPLSMMILGLRFTSISIKDLFLDKAAYIASGIKLLLSPAIAIGLYYLFSLFVDISAIKLNIIALSAMPAATVTMMFCSIFNKDSKAAARTMLLSSILSIITIPLFLLLI